MSFSHQLIFVEVMGLLILQKQILIFYVLTVATSNLRLFPCHGCLVFTVAMGYISHILYFSRDGTFHYQFWVLVTNCAEYWVLAVRGTTD